MLIHQDTITGITITATDTPSHGGACHHYDVCSPEGNVLGRVQFQCGPIAEHGFNGIQHEHLLLILHHRLSCYQMGPYASADNAIAVRFIGGALEADRARTAARRLAGTEGTSKI